MRSSVSRWSAIFVSCVLVATACGGSATLGSSDDFSIQAALAEMPESILDDRGIVEISVVDFVGLTEQTGIQRPSPGSTSRDELVDFFGQITFSRSETTSQIFVPLPELLRATPVIAEEFVDEFGFAPGDVTGLIEVRSGSASFMVLDGVQTRADLPQVAPGIGTIGEGEDQKVGERTAARPLGRPHRVAERNGQLAISRETPPIVEWFEESAAVTLGDDEALVSLARELDDNEIVSALLATRPDAPDSLPTAFGWAVDDDGPLAVVAFHLGTDAAAEDAMDSFRESFETTERVVLESAERSGALLVSRLRFPVDSAPAQLFDLYVRGEGPFSCCGS